MGDLRAALERARQDARMWRLKCEDLRQKAAEWRSQRHGTALFAEADVADAVEAGHIETPGFLWTVGADAPAQPQAAK